MDLMSWFFLTLMILWFYDLQLGCCDNKFSASQNVFPLLSLCDLALPMEKVRADTRQTQELYPLVLWRDKGQPVMCNTSVPLAYNERLC